MGACLRRRRTPDSAWDAPGEYGAAIGLAFQVVDDILDVTQELRRAGQDRRQGRSTTTSRPTCRVMGLDAARRRADALRDDAQAALERSEPGRPAWLASCWPTGWWSARIVTVRTPKQVSKPSSRHEQSSRSNRQPRRPAPPAAVRTGRARRPNCARSVLRSVSRTGGHLSSNLGTVELTIALHYVFDTPDDRLVWDVGHQTYPHKILTGRRERMHTLRQLNGLSAASRAATKASTTPSAQRTRPPRSPLRWAWRSLPSSRASERRAVAIIGDGAMTAGMAFEALNNARHGPYRGAQPAGGAQRQRHVDQPAGGRAEQVPGPADERQFYAAAREGAKRC
jgi:hypothetical protein